MRKIKSALAIHVRAGDRARAGFRRSGEALDQAIALGLPTGVPIKLADGRTFTLEDQFAARNTAFSAKMFARYALKEVKSLPKRPAAPPEGGAA